MTLQHHRRAAIVTVAAALSSHLLAACADSASSPASIPTADAGRDLGPTAAPCGATFECRNHNEACFEAMCLPPPMLGLCDPRRSETEGERAGCYTGARCLAVPGAAGAGGMCTLQAPREVLFPHLRTAPKIGIVGPNSVERYADTFALTMRWTPPVNLPANAVTVAVVFRKTPQAASGTRVSNPEDIAWIWASNEPGGATPGAVGLTSGRRSVNADGTLGAAYTSTRLPNGQYWWLVYAIAEGRLVASSDVHLFRVGGDFARTPCRNVDECKLRLPNEEAELLACVSGICRRRCASNLDCPASGGRCEFATTYTDASNPLPRGALCAL